LTAQSVIATSINSIVNQSDTGGISSKIFSAIKSAATKTGVDFSYLLKKAGQESGFDPSAKASTSSATGLFQFTSQTWLQMVKTNGAQYGLGAYASQISADANGHLSVSDPQAKQAILALRNDPTISAEMAGELDKQNAASLQQNVGGKIGGTELYLAHFLGAGGASDFLSEMRSTPNASGAAVLPDAAAANPSVFYDKAGQPRSLAQIYQHFAQKFDGSLSTQTASVITAASTKVASLSSAPASTQLTGIYSAGSPVTATLATAGFHANVGNPVATTGASTLFTAMVLGQMNTGGIDPAAQLSMFQQAGDKKKSAMAVLSAVA
jgi:hypothetical protein